MQLLLKQQGAACPLLPKSPTADPFEEQEDGKLFKHLSDVTIQSYIANVVNIFICCCISFIYFFVINE